MAVFAREVGYVRWTTEATTQASTKLATSSSRTGEDGGSGDSRRYLPPEDGRVRSRYGVVAAADCYRITASSLPNLGSYSDSTPLSIVGPGCSGSLISTSTVKPKYATPALRARMGTTAVTLWPFAIPNQRVPNATRRRAAERRREAISNLEAMNRRAIEGCEYCDSRVPEDVWHILLECPAARYRSLRQQLMADVPEFLIDVLKLIGEILTRYIKSYGAKDSEVDPVWAAKRVITRDIIERCDWTSPVGHFLLFRLLTVLPFPPSALPPASSGRQVDPSRELLTLLRNLFESICLPRRVIRPLANKWIRWSYKWLIRFAETRCNKRRW